MKQATMVLQTGRDPRKQYGIVNPGEYKASTVLFESVEAMQEATLKPLDSIYYGRHGTPTTYAFEEALGEMEGGYYRAVATSSGLAAITVTLTALTKAGDHILVADTVYGPTRTFCDKVLRSYGVEVEYFAVSDVNNIAEKIKPNTQLVFCESPGSLTFELMDVPMLVDIAHANNVLVALDNTWATPLYFAALNKGVDIAIHAATKYLVGHSDAMLGGIACQTEELYRLLKSTSVRYGHCASTDACWLALRGLRTLAVRLKQHYSNGLYIAQWLEQLPIVSRVSYPALPSSPDHALWVRDFDGATGLFAFELNGFSQKSVNRMINSLQYFGIGYSWGGYESLVLPVNSGVVRTAGSWQPKAPCVRLHIGLEDVEDLQLDLEQGFALLE